MNWLQKLREFFLGARDDKSDFLVKSMAVDTLARTIYGEARGESEEGMEAVANVVLNRARRGGWWGDTIITVCKKPYQFSCWNQSDPNFRTITEITAKNKIFTQCLEIATRAVEGTLIDNTMGANHYHAAEITPYWAKNVRPVAVIGNHIFYKLN